MSGSFVSFDHVRNHLIEALRVVDLPEDRPKIYVVRDMFGKITLSVSEDFESNDRLREALDRLACTIHNRIGAHGRPVGQTVLWVHPNLLRTLDNTKQEIAIGVFLADRVLVGGSWWTVGEQESKHPIRYTLYSVKGGVGRSTTAAVLAWYLAKRGEDVLAVDLDLESPGLASALLEEKVQPEFGVTDWFVEELVGQGHHFIDKIVGSPVWTRDLEGTVWVVPAHGRDPGDYLAKLGRVYMDTAADPWIPRLRKLLDTLENTLKPTVVILESRSGLHDIAAAAVTDIGAEVMLFAVDSPATWTGYGILFEHWNTLGLASDIRERLSIVSALTPELDTERYLERFRENAWDLFTEYLYDTLSAGTAVPTDAVSYALGEDAAPHTPLVIRWNRGLTHGTAVRRSKEAAVAQAYQPFLQRFGQQHQARTAQATPIILAEREADANTVRIALGDLPEGTSHGDAPLPSQLYLPPSHRKALDPNVLLVTGMRGAGKTFWWSTLQDPSVRAFLTELHPRLGPTAKSEVRAGFGVIEAPDSYPGRDEIQAIIRRNVEPRTIWRTVHAHHLTDVDHPLRKWESWEKRANYVKQNPEEITRLFRDCDKKLDGEEKYSIVVFDGLDRCADDWSTMFRLIRGLLRHALAMRSYRRLRAKVFLRLDQADEARVADFPDASKVFSSSAQLTWPRLALYGMLWQYLGNGKHGDALRRRLADGDWPVVESGGEQIFRVPAPLAVDEDIQREQFHSVIAGPWMGTNRKRGFPYTWIPNHLGDAKAMVSPRSFIVALRSAAIDTSNHHPEHDYALHYKSVKHGVREASKIRVQELREDNPWVDSLLRSLRGTVVPCRFEEIDKVWGECQVLDRLSEQISQGEVNLPPRSIDRGSIGVRKDLESLGVFQRLKDGRVNIPDVFRVGYGLGRRGGMKPVR